jgi:hypothetical protein
MIAAFVAWVTTENRKLKQAGREAPRVGQQDRCTSRIHTLPAPVSAAPPTSATSRRKGEPCSESRSNSRRAAAQPQLRAAHDRDLHRLHHRRSRHRQGDRLGRHDPALAQSRMGLPCGCLVAVACPLAGSRL